MPPLPLLPNQPAGANDINWPAMGQSPTWNPAAAPRPVPNATTDKSSYEQDILDAYKQAAGFSREQLAAQTKQAKDSLDYQYAALKQQAKTSKEQLELDRWYKQEQTKLAQQAQQLAEQEFGLSYAKSMTEYLSGPDTMFQARALEGAAGALMAGQRAPGYRAGGDMEQPRQASGFEALAGPLPAGVTAPQSRPAGSMATLYAPAGGGNVASGGAPASATEPTRSVGVGAGGGDKRLRAMRAVADALPPSSQPGLAQRDNSAMRAFEAIYSAPGNDMDRADQAGTALLERGGAQLGLGQYESMLPGTRKALMSLARTRGINPEDWQEDWQRSRPGQQSGLSA